MNNSYLSKSTLLFLVLLGLGCTERESKVIDEVINGPVAVRDLATAAMPANQSRLLSRFRDACDSYSKQQNEIQKSQIFRDTEKFHADVGPIEEWTGTIRSITTNQGGSTASLTILMGNSTIADMDVRLGTEVYSAAGNLSVDQNVIFSGQELVAIYLTEKGKVCNPSFSIKITALRPLDKATQKLLAKTKDTLPAEIEKSKESTEKDKTIPKFADYGTDMASLLKYNADIGNTSIIACHDAWKIENPDAAYCLSQKETGEQKIAMLRAASGLGHPVAKNDLAMYLESGPPGNSKEIVRLVKASAQRGIPHAQVTIGWWYMTGERGIEVDHAEAMKWNLMAYKQGHSEGANNVGELYEKGLGVPEDIEAAKSWYRKAKVLGNAEATERLERLE